MLIYQMLMLRRLMKLIDKYIKERHHDKQSKKKKKKEGKKVVCSECCQGSSYRSFTLDCNVNEAKAQAKYENGMLELILPKKNGATSKQLKIK